MSDEKKLYNQVSPHDLEPEYTQHVMAMTSEKLHYKADIAMELAYRDKQIAALEKRLAEADTIIKKAQELMLKSAVPFDAGCLILRTWKWLTN